METSENDRVDAGLGENGTGDDACLEVDDRGIGCLIEDTGGSGVCWMENIGYGGGCLMEDIQVGGDDGCLMEDKGGGGGCWMEDTRSGGGGGCLMEVGTRDKDGSQELGGGACHLEKVSGTDSDVSLEEEDGGGAHCLEEVGEGGGCLREVGTVGTVPCFVEDGGGSGCSCKKIQSFLSASRVLIL